MRASPGDIAVTHLLKGVIVRKQSLPLYLLVSKSPVLPNMFFPLVLL